VREALAERIRTRRQAILAEFDTDGNGMLDRGELEALHEHMRARVQELRAAVKDEFDADGNGVLDRAERDALREYLRARVRGEYFGSEDRF
jgi:Ca2+-binding EF-hand superfamily protein